MSGGIAFDLCAGDGAVGDWAEMTVEEGLFLRSNIVVVQLTVFGSIPSLRYDCNVRGASVSAAGAWTDCRGGISGVVVVFGGGTCLGGAIGERFAFKRGTAPCSTCCGGDRRATDTMAGGMLEEGDAVAIWNAAALGFKPILFGGGRVTAVCCICCSLCCGGACRCGGALRFNCCSATAFLCDSC